MDYTQTLFMSMQAFTDGKKTFTINLETFII